MKYTFIYKGKTYKNCGPTSDQSNALSEDKEFGAQLRDSYNSDFSDAQGLFAELHDNLSQIVAAGPSQQGFSPEELAARNSQAINSAAASNKAVQAAIGEKAGVQDTANPGVESGVETAVRAGAASKVANNLANEESNVTQQNYETGRQNYEAAVKAEGGLPEETIAPVTQAAGAAISADKATSDQSNENAAASRSWMGLVGGLASGFAKGLMDGKPSGDGSSGPNLQVPSGFDPEAGSYLNQD